MPAGIPPNIVQFTGPTLVGYMVNCILLGALAVQVYIYTLSFPNDRPFLKCLVFGIFIVEFAQTILITHDMFEVFGWGWGDLNQLFGIHLAWLDTPVMSGITSCTVQLFYAYRVFILSRSKILTCVIASLSITELTAAIVAGVQSAIANNAIELQTTVHVSITLWLVGSALCDITIAVCISYYLLRNNTGFRQTQLLVKKLVHLTIETGALTATVATIDLALFLGFPGKAYHIAPSIIIAKLYSNSLVMMMNARSGIGISGDYMSSGTVLELQAARRSLADASVEGRFRDPLKITTTTVHQVSDKSTLDP